MNKIDLTERIERYINKESACAKAPKESDVLSDEEFDEALETIRQNGISFKTVKNARRLKGFIVNDGRIVKDRLLIRSGNLSNLSKEEADLLKNDYQLSLVIDLRTPEEIKKAPDKEIAGVEHRSIPLAMELDTRRMDYLTKLYFESKDRADKARFAAEYARIDEVARMYRSISVNKASKEAVREIFKLLAAAKGAVLFHCTSGKDRTGIIAALILYVLGCSRQDIIRDYNASAVTFMSLAENVKADLGVMAYEDESLKTGLQMSIGVIPEVLYAGFYYIDCNYPSDDSFLQESTGLSFEEIEAFRNKYLK